MLRCTMVEDQTEKILWLLPVASLATPWHVWHQCCLVVAIGNHTGPAHILGEVGYVMGGLILLVSEGARKSRLP